MQQETPARGQELRDPARPGCSSRASEGWKERGGVERREGAGNEAVEALSSGWLRGEGGEAAPGEGKRRRGREGMLLNSFLP